MVVPIRPAARATARQSPANMLDRLGSVPDPERGTVIPPGITVGLQQVSHSGMVKAGKHSSGFAAGGIDHGNRGTGERIAPAAGRARRLRVLRRKQRASNRRSRRSGNDELMRRETGSLVGLEHAVGESVLLGQSKVRLNVG